MGLFLRWIRLSHTSVPINVVSYPSPPQQIVVTLDDSERPFLFFLFQILFLNPYKTFLAPKQSI